MYSIFVKRALIAALFISPLAACANAPQKISPAANNGTGCSGSSRDQLSIEARYRQTSFVRKSDNPPAILETIFCDMFTA